MMIILPLSTYYYTSNYYFEGIIFEFPSNFIQMILILLIITGENKTTYAALAAAGIANVVVFSFIITAIWEDYSSNTQQKRNKED